MAEIRCPMCGKSNPDNLDVCQFCEARLKPLTPQSTHNDAGGGLPEWSRMEWDDDPEEVDSDSYNDSDDIQDWLNRIQPEESDSGYDTPTQIDAEQPFEVDEPSDEGGDDWLQRIRSLHQADQETESAGLETPPADSSPTTSSPDSSTGDDEPGAEETGYPDWLNRLEDESAPTEEDEADEDDFPDWLFPDRDIKPDETLAGTDSGDDLPSWLDGDSDFQEDNIFSTAEDTPHLDKGEPEVEPVEAEIPDLLAELPGESAGAEDTLQTPEEDLPDILSGLEIEAEPPDAVSEDETQDQLTGAGEEVLAFQSEEEDTPDWLSDLGIEAEPPDADAEGGTQDQLTGAGEEALEDVLAFQSQGDEIPEWLSDLGIGTAPPAEDEAQDKIPEPEEEEPQGVPAFQSQDEDTPDWLSSLDIDSEPSPSEVGAEAQEWSFDTQDLDQEATPVAQRPGDRMPHWLTDSGEDKEPDEIEIPDWLSPPVEAEESISAEDEDLQDWFSELDEQGESPGEHIPSASVSETDDDMPGWLKNLGSVVTGTVEEDKIPEIEEGVVAPFIGQEEFGDDLLDAESLPDWLALESESKTSSEEVDESALTPVELPGWLEAMRPVDEGAQGTPITEGPVESAGPLAGLRSILPAEPEITRFKKPPVYSSKLRVTESQLTHANILKQLLTSEGEAEPIPEPPLVSSQGALRWLFALILMVAIGFVVIGGSQFTPLPSITSIPDATLLASKIINNIPDQAPVLLAFDYEPGTAGEMQAAAAALVDHLMLQSARLTLVSTLPTGPALAEHFIHTVQNQHNYTSGFQYVNLGYIPGGAMGLLSFVQTPQWVFPLSYDGMAPWNTQPLQGIETIADFSLVVVITDDPDTARSWVEQVQPRIGDTPMLTVVSAQAEPMVRPYFGVDQNARVRGIISGLTGGAAYEVTIGATNLGRTYWDAFSVGLIIAVSSILIGGTVNIAQLFLARNKTKNEGKAK